MFFANILRDLVPQAVVYHEAGERSRLINILTHAHLSGFSPISAPISAWERAVKPGLLDCPNDIYIDSNNQLYAFIHLHPGFYPGLRVVHLVRDPREYVRSHINWARHRVKSFIANYLTPFWQPNAWLLKEMSYKTWWHLSRFERFCWIWDYKNRIIGQFEHRAYPYLRLRFEDFFDGLDPINELNRLLTFIGQEPTSSQASQHLFDRPINPGKRKTLPPWTQWSRAQCIQLDTHCAQTMTSYQYGLEKEWQTKLVQH
jgi:hypothetical protein